MILGARADLHVLTPPAPMAVEQAAVILDVLDGDLQEAREHVSFLALIDPEERRNYCRVLWCLESRGDA